MYRHKTSTTKLNYAEILKEYKINTAIISTTLSYKKSSKQRMNKLLERKFHYLNLLVLLLFRTVVILKKIKFSFTNLN